MISTPRVYRSGTVQQLIVNLHGNKNTYKITALLKITRSKKIISMATKHVKGDSQTVIAIKVSLLNRIETYFIIHNNSKWPPETHESLQCTTLYAQEYSDM